MATDPFRLVKGDANDSLWAIESIEDYSPEPDLPKIKAKVLLINTVEDVANSPELGTVECAMKAIHDGRYVLIPYSDQTHGHFTPYYAAVWKPYLINFMGTLGPARPPLADIGRQGDRRSTAGVQPALVLRFIQMIQGQLNRHARPTGPRFARPEDRLWGRASTETPSPAGLLVDGQDEPSRDDGVNPLSL